MVEGLELERDRQKLTGLTGRKINRDLSSCGSVLGKSENGGSSVCELCSPRRLV
jgi:hypothetical protein